MGDIKKPCGVEKYTIKIFEKTNKSTAYASLVFTKKAQSESHYAQTPPSQSYLNHQACRSTRNRRLHGTHDGLANRPSKDGLTTRGERPIVRNQKQHGLFQPIHVVPTGMRKALPILLKFSGEVRSPRQACTLICCWLLRGHSTTRQQLQNERGGSEQSDRPQR